MRRFSGMLVAALIVTTAAYAQTPPKANGAQPKAQSTDHHPSSQMVVVDVAVQDKDGHPVHSLKPEDFRLTEDKVPQPLLHVEEHSALTPVRQGP